MRIPIFRLVFAFWFAVWALQQVMFPPAHAQMTIEPVMTTDVSAQSFHVKQFRDRFENAAPEFAPAPVEPPLPELKGEPGQDIRILLSPKLTYTRKWIEAQGFRIATEGWYALGVEGRDQVHQEGEHSKQETTIQPRSQQHAKTRGERGERHSSSQRRRREKPEPQVS